MKPQFVLFVIGFLFSSCATIFNSRTVDIRIHADTDSLKLCINNDSSRWYYPPTWINVERSRNDLIITAKKDSIQKSVIIKRRASTAFWLGNLLYGYGLGYLIDLTNPKRFTYPPTLTLNFKSADKLVPLRYKTWIAPEKHLLNFKISIPEGNHFFLETGHGYTSMFGYCGLTAGAEYYFTNKYCINMNLGLMTNFITPLPFPFAQIFGNYEESDALFSAVQIGSDYKKLHYSAGLQYNYTYYYKKVTSWFTPSSDTLYKKTKNNFGLAFSTSYRLSKGFSLGLRYYPSLLSWDKEKFQAHYTHLLFFELIINVEAYTPSNGKGFVGRKGRFQ